MTMTHSNARILPPRDSFGDNRTESTQGTDLQGALRSCFIESRKVKAERPLKNPLIGPEIKPGFYEFLDWEVRARFLSERFRHQTMPGWACWLY